MISKTIWSIMAVDKDLASVSEASLAVLDYTQHLIKYVGTLDYTLDVLVNNKDIQAHPDDVAKVVRLRNALRDALKGLDKLEEETERFKEAFDA